MSGRITILSDNTEWVDECSEILNGLQIEYQMCKTEDYPDNISPATDLLLAILPRPDHPVVMRLDRFRSARPGIPILSFFPKEELKDDQWVLLKRLDGVAALPLDSVSVMDILKLVGDHRILVSHIIKLKSQCSQLDAAYQVFVSVGRTVASSLEVDRVITRIMMAAGDLLHSEAWSVALKETKSGDLIFRAAQGEAADQIIGLRVPRGKGIVGYVSENGEPLIVPDTSKDHRHFKAADDTSGFVSKSILCMPLKTKEKNLGAIEFINKLGSQFSTDDMDRVQVLLDLAAVSLDNAMMFESLKVITETDELSGLYNQKALMRRLEKLIEESRLNNTSFGYIFLDLDYLKRVNDRYGHLRGRAVIQEVGHLLHEKLSSSTIIGRYGGDEFWVILPSADKIRSMTVAEEIRLMIAEHVFLEQQSLSIRLTASIGVVVFPQHARSFDQLAQLADEALFMAKSHNRNRVICALDTLPPGGIC
ncbi:sensor domain-containing diguanylate cyclase, partial [bacterium]|nr:sensor domain-containing diguanylate cyclase [bacterium]